MASQIIAVRVTASERRIISARAKKQNVSLGSYFRVAAGLKPQPLGGAREGAGRPKKAEESSQ